MPRKGLTPQGWYDSPIAGHVHYQSGYERKFMQYLDSKNFNWTKCKERFPYKDSDGKNHTYNPDFYLPDYNLYVEVKGMIRKNDPAKFEAFPKDKELVLVDCEKMKDLGIKVFDPMSIKEPIDKTKWPYKLLSKMPDYAEVGILSEELKTRLYKNNIYLKGRKNNVRV